MANSTANSAASSATPSNPPSDPADTATRRARTRIIAGSWRLPLVVLVGVLLAGALVTLYGSLNRHPAPQSPRAVTGVVIASEPCAQAGARDTVRVQIDGRTERLPINACGNPAGFQLDVELLTAEDGSLSARLAGTGGRPSADLAARISAVLLVLAGLAGAALVMQLVPGASPTPTPMPAASASDPPPGTDGWSAPLYPAPLEVGSGDVGPTPIVWPTEDPPPDRTRARSAVAWPTEEPAPNGSRPATLPPERPRTRRGSTWPAREQQDDRQAVAWPTSEPTPTPHTPSAGNDRPVAWPTGEPAGTGPAAWPGRKQAGPPAEEPAETTDPYLARRWPGLR